MKRSLLIPIPVKMIMNLSNFFLSYPGMYVTQSVFHSLVAVIIAESAIQVWHIENPVMKQRFRFLVVLLPVLLYPLYQLFNPERGSLFFRLDTLVDLNRWLYLELWGLIPLNILFLFLLFLAGTIFLFQEMIPILKHSLESRGKEEVEEVTEPDTNVLEVLERLPGETPNLFIIDDDEYIISSSTGKNAAIFLSTGLIGALTQDQLQSALAHEIAHIERSKKPLILFVFFLRVVMFFNPVVLIEFRRIVQEEEKICDEMSVSLTKNPDALAQTLQKLYHQEGKNKRYRIKKISDIRASLEEYSHTMLIENRIKRLNQRLQGRASFDWPPFILTLISIVLINYFIV